MCCEENGYSVHFVDLAILFVYRPITLVVAKCWDPNPKGYLTIPRQEPVRPIDPSAWVNHTEAMRNMEIWGRTGPPSVSTMTSTSSSIISSIPANECMFLDPGTTNVVVVVHVY